MSLRKFSTIARLLLGILLLASVRTSLAFTVTASVSGTIYNTDGSVPDVNNAFNACTAGSTILLPPGTFTWGTNGGGLGVSKSINLFGSGTGQTTIAIDPTSPLNAIIPLFTTGTAGHFTVMGGGANSNTAPFSTQGPNGFELTDINYNANQSNAYFLITNGNYGLIDNCTITSDGGGTELIFGRGPSNAWQSPTTMGSVNAVIIESSTFNGPGYVCDANANAAFVIRFCTINGPMKVDAHGMESNTPPRSCRQIEIYDNTWTYGTTYNWNFLELRGGTGMVFNNTGVTNCWYSLNCYATQADWPNAGTYYTAAMYPAPDQIGMGEDVYLGGTNQFSNGHGWSTPAGFVESAPGAQPLYTWNNTDQGVPYPIGGSAITPAAQSLYQTQVKSSSAYFTMVSPLTSAYVDQYGDHIPVNAPGLIQEGRDFFEQGGITGTATFTGTDGMGVGTTAQMNAITPTKKGVGFWVTDQGSWNTNVPPGTSGELYTWNGSAWVLTYVPYIYPDPVRLPPAPTGLRLTGSNGG
jgi:hypothetical protein